MDEAKKEDFLRKRQERMNLVIPSVEHETQIPVLRGNEENISSEKDKLGYSIQLYKEDIEYIEKYSYWMGVARKKRYTYSETISDAIRLLRKHSPIEVKPIPEWVPRRKNRALKKT